MTKPIVVHLVFCRELLVVGRKLLLVLLFFHEIHQIFGQFAVRFDHIGDERKNKKLQPDKKRHSRKKQVIAVGGNFEVLKIEKKESDKDCQGERYQE